jgi:ATP-dependent protease HslVU (ClpYQ) peptidase subunit
MTCIVGLAVGGRVVIGGDSAGVAAYDLNIRADKKVFRNGPFVMGCTSSFRMSQLLRYALKVPERSPDHDVMSFMSLDFINAARTAFKDGGFARKKDEAEIGGAFLVGYAGRLFTVHEDYQIAETESGYAACGCGESYALGAMFALASPIQARSFEPRDILDAALRAAEAHSAGVRGPFHFEE